MDERPGAAMTVCERRCPQHAHELVEMFLSSVSIPNIVETDRIELC